LGLLKAKLAKYRSQLLEPSKKGEKGDGFDVLKSGDARVALIGFPSVGKSTMLSTLTKTESEAGMCFTDGYSHSPTFNLYTQSWQPTMSSPL